MWSIADEAPQTLLFLQISLFRFILDVILLPTITLEIVFFLPSFNFLDLEGEVFMNLKSTKLSTIVITVGKSLTTCLCNYDMKWKACPYLTCS